MCFLSYFEGIIGKNIDFIYIYVVIWKVLLEKCRFYIYICWILIYIFYVLVIDIL